MVTPFFSTALGQIWHGDCLDLMSNIPAASVDLVLCDLPFGTTKCSWDSVLPFDQLWAAYKRVVKPNHPIVLFGSQPFSSMLVASNIKMFKYEWIWHKSKSGSAFTAQYRPVNKHENILVFGEGRLPYYPQMTEGEPYTRTHRVADTDINNHKLGFNKKEVVTTNTGVRYPTTVQFFQQKWRRQDQLHPTQKPVDLCAYLIQTYTQEGDLVLDNCAGSFTTAAACENTNRQWLCIEKELQYCEIGKQRLC